MIRALLILLLSTGLATAAELRIGTSPDFPPYISKTGSGDLEGFDYDLMSDICTFETLNCVWVDLPFKSLIPALKSEDIDVAVGGISITKDRLQQISFSAPYFGKSEGGLLLSRPNPPRTVETGTIAVQTGTIYDLHATSVGWNVVRFEDANDAIRAAANGDTDYVFSSQASLLVVLDMGRTSLVFAGATNVLSEGQAVALPKNRSDLKALIDRNIARLDANGLLEKLRQKWFSTST